MQPTWIPDFDTTIKNLSGNPKLKAEKFVAEELNKIASPDVRILHSLRYTVKKEIGAAVNLEIDFLVIWKNRGFLILEVKGGRVDFDTKQWKWWITPHNHPRKEYSRSPVDQVEGQKNDLCKYILPRFLSKGLNARSMVERVLIFPDVNVSDFQDQRGQRPQRIADFDIDSIIDKDLIPSLASLVEKKLEPTSRYVHQQGIPWKVFEDTTNFLRSSVRAEVAPQHIFEEAESQIEEATNEQKAHLSHVMETRWLLMKGPAGSAKTVLGLSAVLTWAKSGTSAYYITENKYLVEGLRNDSRYSQVKDHILSIHEFLEMSLQRKVENDTDSMIKALIEFEFPNEGYNLVIDEIQDLNYGLYENLVSLLPCERLWVLWDSSQSLEKENDKSPRDIGLLDRAITYNLTKNCRNTRKIAQHIVDYVNLPNDYLNDILLPGDQYPIEYLVSSVEEQDKKLLKIIEDEKKLGTKQEHLVVLSCEATGRTAVYDKYCSPQGINAFNGKFCYGRENCNEVAIYHCLDFRGLESPIVIVTDIQDQESVFRANYLAGSRAKYKLILIRIEDEIIDNEPVKTPKGLIFE